MKNSSSFAKSPIFIRLRYPSAKNNISQSSAESKILSKSTVATLSKTNEEYRDKLRKLNSRINTIIERSYTLKSQKSAQVIDNSINLEELNKKVIAYE